jgi:hypothetical protein
MLSLANAARRETLHLVMAVVAQVDRASHSPAIQAQVEVVFLVYSQEVEQLLPLSLQVAAAEHHGESTQIPLLAVVAEAVPVVKEQMLKLQVVQGHCLAVVQLQPALHNAP